MGKVEEQISLAANVKREYGNVLTAENRALLSKLETVYAAAKNKACDEASYNIYKKLLPDFDQEYRNHLVVLPTGTLSNGVTIYDLACAATHKGVMKKFSGSGLFSKTVTLELEQGAYKFTLHRYNLNTMNEVSDSFKGENVVNVLKAVEFAPAKGFGKAIQDSNTAMRTLFGQLGGYPQAPECLR